MKKKTKQKKSRSTNGGRMDKESLMYIIYMYAITQYTIQSNPILYICISIYCGNDYDLNTNLIRLSALTTQNKIKQQNKPLTKLTYV